MPKIHPADAETQKYQKADDALSPFTRRVSIITIMVLSVTILFFGAWLVCRQPEKFSEQENRVLATAPTFTVPSFLDGTFTEALSDFCSDQFPLRSWWIRLKAKTELLLGKRENNDVLFGKDDFLLVRDHATEETEKNLSQNFQAIAKFHTAMDENAIPFYSVIIPRSIDVNTEKLPAVYDTFGDELVWQWANDAALSLDQSFISLRSPLQDAAKQDLPVWYRTDHHWTTQGAYIAYCTLADTLGYTPCKESDFTPVTVSTDFHGTTQSSSGMYWLAGDDITLWRFEGDEQKRTEILEGDGQAVKSSFAGLYDFSYLDVKDKYSLFLGGTNTLIRVTDTQNPDLPWLVLLKDSFSQSLAPFLSRHYNLLLIDPRTVKPTQSTVFEVTIGQKPQAVLLLVGMDTLTEARSLAVLSLGLPSKTNDK